MIKEFNENVVSGFEIQGQNIAMLRFVDDITLLEGNKNE